ncbi:type II toxin-antitoxin system VapC family toxin [Leptolyngbya sp. AN03gr2]|uniref:type II toxin-antitoxin system VapC family toxin n=1 Tax=unclassified Leptolyngbya TaxID=2650499 RepID=UPI003D311749
MNVLYDASVLIAALLIEHENHNLALSRLEMARQGVVKGYVSTHSLAELYSVMTRLPLPLRVLPDEAEAAIVDLLDYLEPVPLFADEYQQAIRRMVTLKLVGGGIFDAVIAQAALKAEVEQLLTFNPKDFTRLGDEIASIVQVPS